KPPPHAPGVPLLLLIHCTLIAHIEIGSVACRQSETLRCKRVVHSLSDLLIDDLIGMNPSRNFHPLIGVVLREISTRHEVVMHLLSHKALTHKECDPNKHQKPTTSTFRAQFHCHSPSLVEINRHRS